MSIRQFLPRLRRSRQPNRLPHNVLPNLFRPHLETLEQRTVPSILFPKNDIRTVRDNGGPVIEHADVELIFWGAGWNSGVGPTLRTNLTAAAGRIVSGPFLTLLSQYRSTIGPGSVVDALTIASSSPPSTFTDSQVQTMLRTNIGNGTLPDPGGDSQLLYMVIPQPGSIAPGNIGGEHNSALSGTTRFHYGWTINDSRQSTITNIFSHELMEAASDAEPSFRPGLIIPATNDEVCDGVPNLQNYTYVLNGDVVQACIDGQNNAYSVADGNTQNFSITTGHSLIINGDQLADPNDTITLDLSGSATRVTLNGEAALFAASGAFGVTSIVINSGHGDDTINIDQTSAARPVTINLGDGTDTVNLAGASGNLNNITGAVTINGGGGTDTLNLFDQANTAVKAYRLTATTFSRATMGNVTYNGITNLAINLGSAATNTFTVAGAGAAATAVNGSGTGGTLIGPDDAASWEITGPDAGVLNAGSLGGPVTFSGVFSVKGGAGDNTFVLDDGQGVDGQILGGVGGTNTLDYSAYSSTVLVNLQTGLATGVAGGVGGIQNVLGGNGGGGGVYNILVGNGGNVLTGGVGRTNLLIAGGTASMLIGGDSGDILIGGTTAYDQEAGMFSLQAIMNYWSSTSDDYATRVANLLSGNGVPLLDGSMVTNNGGGNTMYGNNGGAGALSLYYGLDPTLETTDYNPAAGEQFINV
jgi:hypothetical protein